MIDGSLKQRFLLDSAILPGSLGGDSDSTPVSTLGVHAERVVTLVNQLLQLHSCRRHSVRTGRLIAVSDCRRDARKPPPAIVI